LFLPVLRRSSNPNPDRQTPQQTGEKPAMTKAAPKVTDLQEAETPQEPSYQYDASKGQTIPLTVEKNGRKFRVTHSFKPLTNERFFEFQERIEEVTAKLTKYSTAMYEPKETLWNELIESVTGYKEREDFKAGVHLSHRTEAINGLITIQFVDEDSDAADAALWDIDDLTVIKFKTLQAGVLLTDMSHSFRSETKAEMDQFLAIESDQPEPNVLASAQKLSKAEKLCRLGKKLLMETTGYANGVEIPAWHLAATVESFFARQIAQAKR
jgi:hypothetical protein